MLQPTAFASGAALHAESSSWKLVATSRRKAATRPLLARLPSPPPSPSPPTPTRSLSTSLESERRRSQNRFQSLSSEEDSDTEWETVGDGDEGGKRSPQRASQSRAAYKLPRSAKSTRTKFYNSPGCSTSGSHPTVGSQAYPTTGSALLPIQATPENNIETQPSLPIEATAMQGPKTPILDLSFPEIAQHMVEMGPTVISIKASRVRAVQRAFRHQLLKTRLSPDQEREWKKLFLLPVLLLSYISDSVFNNRIKRCGSDTNNIGIPAETQQPAWDFTLEELTHRKPVITAQSNLANANDKALARQLQRVEELVKADQISAAMNVLCRELDHAPMTPEDAYVRLENKHPFPMMPPDRVMQRKQQIAAMTLDAETDVIPQIESVEEMMEIIRTCPKRRSPGPDKLRFDHLQTLGCARAQMDAGTRDFLDELRSVFNLILAAKIPSSVAAMLATNEIIALPKGDGDVRPIGIGSTYRKIASKVVYTKLSSACEMKGYFFSDVLPDRYERKDGYRNAEEPFQKTQHASSVCGIETIVHLTNMLLSMPHKLPLDLYTIDARNAFNQVDRLEGLLQAAHLDRGCLPFIRAMYLEDSASNYFGCGDGVRTILSRAGFHQGDVLGSLLFCIAIQPLVDFICQSVMENFPADCEAKRVSIHFYVDDGTFVAPHEVMKHIITLLQDPVLQMKFGYVLNPSKGAYLLGKCTDYDQAQQRITDLENMGLSPDIIRAHPDNVIATADDGDVDEAASKYGAKVLGSFVGTTKYISKQLAAYAQELRVVRDKLNKMQNSQCRLLLFRKSFCCKPLHIFRTIPPMLTKEFALAVEDIKKGFVAEMLEFPTTEDLPSDVFDLMSHPIQAGGLGFYNVGVVSSAAFVASLMGCLRKLLDSDRVIDLLMNGRAHLQDLCGTLVHFYDSIEALKLDADPLTAFTKLFKLSHDRELGSIQAQLMDHVTEKRLSDLRGKICATTVDINQQGRVHNVPQQNRARLYMFNSLRNKEAGAWLQATPKNAYLEMTNKQMNVALRHRYFLPQSCVRPATKCSCSGRPIVDRFGHHYIQGCGLHGFRTRSHDLLSHQLTLLLRYFGMDCKREESGRFTDIDPRHRHRPDITVYNPPMEDHLFPIKTSPVVIDISVASAIKGAGKGSFMPISEAAAMKPGQQADSRVNDKISKYKMLDPHNTLHFVPFVLESSGLMHSTARAFLRLGARKASEILMIPAENLYSYAVKCLSMTFQRCVANNIIQHSYAAAVKSTDIILQKDPGFRDSQLIGDTLRD